MTVSQLLSNKSKEFFSVVSTITVFEALQIMNDKDVGALMVIEDGVLKGIFSERDYARKIILKNKASKETLIHEIMNSDVITVMPDASIEHCMMLMSNKHVRHLPVLENNRVIGIISIGDVVFATINQQKELINQLSNYIQS